MGGIGFKRRSQWTGHFSASYSKRWGSLPTTAADLPLAPRPPRVLPPRGEGAFAWATSIREQLRDTELRQLRTRVGGWNHDVVNVHDVVEAERKSGTTDVMCVAGTHAKCQQINETCVAARGGEEYRFDAEDGSRADPLMEAFVPAMEAVAELPVETIRLRIGRKIKLIRAVGPLTAGHISSALGCGGQRGKRHPIREPTAPRHGAPATPHAACLEAVKHLLLCLSTLQSKLVETIPSPEGIYSGQESDSPCRGLES